MRKHIPNRLKEFFRIALLQCREKNRLSQEEMAHRLAMVTRSYIGLEHGESCSSVTFVLFLLYLCPDPTAFLNELRRALDDDREAA